MDYLHELAVKKGHHSDLPFGGGAIGFVGYDMISLYEEIGQIPADVIGTPDMHFFVYESYMVFDHKKDKVYILEEALYSNRSEADLATSLERIMAELAQPAADEFSPLELSSLNFQSHIEQAAFEKMVEEARSLIRQGDMFQCVLSQRFSAEYSGKPLDYCAEIGRASCRERV